MGAFCRNPGLPWIEPLCGRERGTAERGVRRRNPGVPWIEAFRRRERSGSLLPKSRLAVDPACPGSPRGSSTRAVFARGGVIVRVARRKLSRLAVDGLELVHAIPLPCPSHPYSTLTQPLFNPYWMRRALRSPQRPARRACGSKVGDLFLGVSQGSIQDLVTPWATLVIPIRGGGGICCYYDLLPIAYCLLPDLLALLLVLS